MSTEQEEKLDVMIEACDRVFGPRHHSNVQRLTWEAHPQDGGIVVEPGALVSLDLKRSSGSTVFRLGVPIGACRRRILAVEVMVHYVDEVCTEDAGNVAK